MAALPAAGDTAGWIEARSPVLPAPTGAAPVGVRAVHLVDTGRIDPLAPDRRHRELMVTVHYPADRDRGSLADLALAPYTSEQVADRWGRSMSAAMGIRRDAVNWQFRTHAHEHAPVAAGRHPVVIYTPPPGKPRFVATSLAQDLASHGYIVVAVDHTYESPVVEFPGRRLQAARGDWRSATAATRAQLMRTRADDIHFVATQVHKLDDELAGAVDDDRIAVIGHVSPLREGPPLQLVVPLDVTYSDDGFYRPSTAAVAREAHVRRSVRAALDTGLAG
jgi:predicted dienelactone hydrolase